MNHFPFRAGAVLAALLVASSAFAQIKPDVPPISSPPSMSDADSAAFMNLIAPLMDATNQAIATFSSTGDGIGARHRAVLDALAAANASAAVTNCVTSYQTAESAAFATKIRQEFARIFDELKKQRPAVLNAWLKRAQQQQTGGGDNANATQAMLTDINAVFDRMTANVEILQDKIIASAR